MRSRSGRRSKKASKPFREAFGHTPLSVQEKIPWKCRRLVVGTGALGLEALSRGASSADFVETRPSSLHALRANVALLRARDQTRIFKRDALPFAAALEEDSYDVVFVDPPYGSRMLDMLAADLPRFR